MQSPISNDCLKFDIDGHNRLQNFPKLLLHVSIQELHNSLVSDTKDGGLKEARDPDHNIIISDSELRSLFPSQLKKPAQYKFMSGCECYISAKSIYYSLLSWRDQYFKKTKDQIQNFQNIRYGENLIVYMKHIKYSHATWASYLRQIILYYQGKQICISTVRSYITTLEMCIEMLC